MAADKPMLVCLHHSVICPFYTYIVHFVRKKAASSRACWLATHPANAMKLAQSRMSILYSKAALSQMHLNLMRLLTFNSHAPYSDAMIHCMVCHIKSGIGPPPQAVTCTAAGCHLSHYI